jgi:hypothetical protein
VVIGDALPTQSREYCRLFVKEKLNRLTFVTKICALTLPWLEVRVTVWLPVDEVFAD